MKTNNIKREIETILENFGIKTGYYISKQNQVVTIGDSALDQADGVIIGTLEAELEEALQKYGYKVIL